MCKCVHFFSSHIFLFAIVLSVLRFTDSDYPFGIFKLFFLVFVSILYKDWIILYNSTMLGICVELL